LNSLEKFLDTEIGYKLVYEQLRMEMSLESILFFKRTSEFMEKFGHLEMKLKEMEGGNTHLSPSSISSAATSIAGNLGKFRDVLTTAKGFVGRDIDGAPSVSASDVNESTPSSENFDVPLGTRHQVDGKSKLDMHDLAKNMGFMGINGHGQSYESLREKYEQEIKEQYSAIYKEFISTSAPMELNLPDQMLREFRSSRYASSVLGNRKRITSSKVTPISQLDGKPDIDLNSTVFNGARTEILRMMSTDMLPRLLCKQEAKAAWNAFIDAENELLQLL